jgi:hypothetical protein
MHPSANWLRVPDHICRSALERNIELGKPDEVHFWGSELPALLQHPEYRRQAEERIAELQSKSDAISDQVKHQVSSLFEGWIEQGTPDPLTYGESKNTADEPLVKDPEAREAMVPLAKQPEQVNQRMRVIERELKREKSER